MVSQYNYPDEEKYGIRTLINVVLKRLSIYGFICFDAKHLEKYLPTFHKDMVTWITEGKMKTREELILGIDKAPDAFLKMLTGDKFGKLVLKID
jgi:NADPH-dependent curcumin reductase CurA